MSTRSSPPDHSVSAHPSVLVELRDVGIYYSRGHRGLLRFRGDRLWALESVSLQVRAGETLGIIGRNGVGKSTLLKVLAGILQPDRGKYINYGYQATLLSLQVGFVPDLSGRENAILSGLLLGLSLNEIKSRIDEIIAFAELEEFIDEPIQTYSSGMKARLGFATAFHIQPDILLIDEVLGVGDAAFAKKSKAVMRERLKSNKTVVMVSHSASSIRSLCDRTVWIEGGRVRAEGQTSDVLRQYNAYLDKRAKPKAK